MLVMSSCILRFSLPFGLAYVLLGPKNPSTFQIVHDLNVNIGEVKSIHMKISSRKSANVARVRKHQNECKDISKISLLTDK